MFEVDSNSANGRPSRLNTGCQLRLKSVRGGRADGGDGLVELRPGSGRALALSGGDDAGTASSPHVLWGRDGLMLYNDADRTMIGSKHSDLRGRLVSVGLRLDRRLRRAAAQTDTRHRPRHRPVRPARPVRAQRPARRGVPHRRVQPAARRSRGRRHARNGCRRHRPGTGRLIHGLYG